MAAADAQFTTLYEEHASRVYTYLLRLTSSEADAADALQEAFTGLYVRLADGAAIEHPRAYLFAAARNAALRRLSDADRASLVPEVPEEAAPSPLGDGEAGVLTGDLRAEVRAAERALPARQREVLVLREVEELSYADIASLMELTENGAAQLAWRARASLRAGLRGTALRSIAPAGAACERARTLLELREDAPLAAAEETWVDEHLAACERCTASRAAMLEVGTTYRAAFPLALAPVAAEALLKSAHVGGAGGVASPGGVPSSPGDPSAAAGSSGGFPSSFPVPVGAAAGVVVIVLAIGTYLAGVAPGARGADKARPAGPIALAPSDPAKPIAAARRHAAKAAAARRAASKPAASVPAKAGAKAGPSTTSERKRASREAKRRGGGGAGAGDRGAGGRAGGGSISGTSANGAGPAQQPAASGGGSSSSPAKAVAPDVVASPKTKREPRRATPATPAVPATPAQPKADLPATPATPAVPATPAAPTAPEPCVPRGNNGRGKGGATC